MHTPITQYASYAGIVAISKHNSTPGGCPWVPFALRLAEVALAFLADVA